MRFMLMVKANKDSEAGVLPDEKVLSEMGEYNAKLAEAGALLAGEGLRARPQGARIGFANGKFKVIDGPFAETKELVAGFWLIQAESLAKAVDWAKRVPFREGEVEIRPLFEVSDIPVDAAEQPAGWREKEEELRAAPPPERKPGTVRYIALLKGDKDSEAGVMPDEQVLTAMGAFFEEGTKSGTILGGEGLQPTSKGSKVHYSGSKRTVIDGPFTETKEVVAGYALIQTRTWQEAVEWTKRFVTVDAPGRPSGVSTCELRRIFEVEDFPVSPAEKAGSWREQELKQRDGARR